MSVAAITLRVAPGGCEMSPILAGPPITFHVQHGIIVPLFTVAFWVTIRLRLLEIPRYPQPPLPKPLPRYPY